MRGSRVLAAAVCAAIVSGCVQSSIKGYADREPPARRISHIVTYVSAPLPVANALLTSVAYEARRRSIVAEDAFEIFPPTRTYSEPEIRRDLLGRGASAVLIIRVGDSGVVAQYAGTLFSGQYTATTTGLTTRGNWTGDATPVYRQSRTTEFVAQLIDPATNRTLWTGQGVVSASGGGILGRMVVSDTVGPSNAARTIFEDLQGKGIIDSVR